MTMILLIDNYDSFTYNLAHYLGISGAQCEVRRNDDVTIEAAREMRPDAIVISPGPCSPNEAGICCDLVQALAPTIPILGVCLGHQVIGQVYGAKIVRAPKPIHGKVEEIFHNQTGVFEGLSSPTRATRYHSLMISLDSLPQALEVNARTEDGIIMGVRHRQHPVHGVQFHPESIASEAGLPLIGNFLKLALSASKVTATR